MHMSLSRARDIHRDSGLRDLALKIPPYAVQQLHPYLPQTGYLELNGVTSPIARRALVNHLPDYLTQYVPTDEPEYEAQYIGALRDQTTAGDRVVLVGGGNGISTVAAARQTGDTGSVAVFEAGATQVERTRAAAGLNGVRGRVHVQHAVVGGEHSVRSTSTNASHVPVGELPECDVLGVDADGAELDILAALDGGPERLVVEHHAVYDDGECVLDAQMDTVRQRIQTVGYTIVDERSHPARAYGHSEERIFTAERT